MHHDKEASQASEVALRHQQEALVTLQSAAPIVKRIGFATDAVRLMAQIGTSVAQVCDVLSFQAPYAFKVIDNHLKLNPIAQVVFGIANTAFEVRLSLIDSVWELKFHRR